MRLGQVIYWKNFPHQIDCEIKPRWFVYIGKYTFGSLNHEIYLYTTTTKKEYYESGGRREKNLTI